MIIPLPKIRKFIYLYTQTLGFKKKERRYILKNLIEAEISGKKSHGLISLLPLTKEVVSRNINISDEEINSLWPHPCFLKINGKKKTGYSVIPQSLDIALPQIKEKGIICVGIENFGYSSGFIGHYARICAKKNLIFIGFNKSPNGVIPYGSKKVFLGTNPLTIGIPNNPIPIILDMASSSITWGDLLLAWILNKKIPLNLALDSFGNPTNDPLMAMKGGIFPIANHKGSGLSFVIDILAYLLITSTENYQNNSRWGCLYFLIDPTIFLPINIFRKRVKELIKNLKKLPKQSNVKSIFFPGEKSSDFRNICLKNNSINISYKVWKVLNSSFDNIKNIS